MLKKFLAVIVLLALLAAGLPAGVFAEDYSKLPSLVYYSDATLYSEFGKYNSITIKSGAHVVFKGGFEIFGALIVEPGATLTGVDQPGDFCFALSWDCVVEGIDLWFRQDIGSGETEIYKIQEPVLETLNRAGLGAGFKWDAAHGCWVLSGTVRGNPLNLPVGGFDPSEPVDLSTLRSKTYDGDAVMDYGCVTFNAVTVKSGAHVVCSGIFAIAGSLTVEEGASFTGVEQDSKFCFSLAPGCVVEGLDLWYTHSSGGKTELQKIPEPVMATLQSVGASGEFKWDSESACWVLANDSMAGFQQGQTDAVAFHTDQDKDWALHFANAFKTLGLMNGTRTNADGTTDFALGRPATRAEALVMLLRLLGEYDAADTAGYENPFSDKCWADRFIGYAYETGLTKGYPDGTFHWKDDVTFRQYMTFLMRALGYTDADAQWSGTLYGDALTYAERGGMFSRDYDPYQICTEEFWRMDMVVASWRVMLWTTKDGIPLYERLAEQGLFTREEFINEYLHTGSIAPESM